MDFDQFVLKGTKVADPLLDEAQLLGDERSQPGPYQGTSFGSKFADQRFESLHIPVAGGSRPGAEPRQTFGAPQANAA